MSFVYKFCLINTVVCFALCASCLSDTKDSLVGKWKNKEGKDTIEFFKEGTVCARENYVELCGTYRFVDDNRIRVRFGSMGEIEIYNIAFSDNELTIFFPNGESDRFKKVNQRS